MPFPLLSQDYLSILPLLFDMNTFPIFVFDCRLYRCSNRDLVTILVNIAREHFRAPLNEDQSPNM